MGRECDDNHQQRAFITSKDFKEGGKPLLILFIANNRACWWVHSVVAKRLRGRSNPELSTDKWHVAHLRATKKSGVTHRRVESSFKLEDSVSVQHNYNT